MKIRTRLLGDFAVAVFVLVLIAYMISLALFAAGRWSGRAGPAPWLASTVAGLWFCTFIAWALVFPDLNRRDVRNKDLWGLGFVFLGAIVIPIYYFAKARPSVTADGVRERFRFADIAVVVYVGLAMIVFGWTIFLALSHSTMSTPYRVFAAAHSVTTFIVWAWAAVVLVRLAWPAGKKLLWAVAFIVAPFITLPLFYGLHMRYNTG